MNIDLKNHKKELQKDTTQLQELINNNSNINIENLLDFLDSTWHLPILNLAIENDNTEMIQNILNKTNNTDLINQDAKSKRDLNRKKLLKVFFKKKIL